MLTHPTLDQLRQLGLAGMARAFEDLAANIQGGELAPAELGALARDVVLVGAGARAQAERIAGIALETLAGAPRQP